MNFTSETGGIQRVTFEAVKETLAGGVMLDLTGYTNADNIVPAGTLITTKNATTGLATVLGTWAANSKVLGFVHQTVAVKPNTAVSVVTGGTIRVDALPTALQANVADLKAALPKMDFAI